MESVFRNEVRLLLRRPGLYGAALLFFALCAHAGHTGSQRIETARKIQAEDQARLMETFRARRERAGEVARGERTIENMRQATDAGRVNGVEVPMALPLQSAAGLALGHSLILPNVTKASLMSSSADLFQRQQIDDPEGLLLGHLDLATIVVVILPLLVLFLFYDLLSYERDRRMLPTLVTQAGSLAHLLSTKLLVRSITIVTLVVTGVLLAGLFFPLAEASVALPFLLCLAGVLAYTAFWVAAAVLVASFPLRRETAAAALLLLWLVLIVLIPGTSDLFARWTTDSGALLREVATRRMLTSEAERAASKTLEDYLYDHPELASTEAQDRFGSAFLKESFAVRKSVDAALMESVAARSAELAAREEVLGKLAFLSPPALLHRHFLTMGGTDHSRYHAYQSAARTYLTDFHQTLAPFLWAGVLLKPEDFDRIQPFTLPERNSFDLIVRSLPAILTQLLFASLLLFLARRRLSSYLIA